jgi:hypothetical protein
MLIKLDYLFTGIHSNIKIPQEYVRGFQYYCVEDTDLVGSLNSNKTLSQFLIIILAKKYNKIIVNEKKNRNLNIVFVLSI